MRQLYKNNKSLLFLHVQYVITTKQWPHMPANTITLTTRTLHHLLPAMNQQGSTSVINGHSFLKLKNRASLLRNT